MSQTGTSKKTTPAVIVFGQTDKGGKHAAWFSADESVSAKRAASLRSLAVIDPIPEGLNETVTQVPRGRFLVGQISLSKVAPDLYGKLLACFEAQKATAGPAPAPAGSRDGGAGATTGTAGAEPLSSPQAPTASDPWQQIKAGDIILAEYSKEDGWWEARVMSVEGNLLRLSWCDGSGQWREVRSKVGVLPQRP